MKPLFAAAFILTSLSMPVHAQDRSVCMSTAEMEAALVDWYGETPAQQNDDGSIIWASGIGGTWTIVTYEPNGISCTLAQGDDWSPNLGGNQLIAQLEQGEG